MSDCALDKSHEQLRLEGNHLYGKKQYSAALRCYDLALQLHPTALIIHLNRAAVLLEMHEYYRAYQAALIAYDNHISEKKALFRLGKAAYGMRDWKTATDHLKTLCSHFPSNKQAISELNKANSRLAESQTGNYSLMEMYKRAVVENRLYLDVANYQGPVKVGNVEGKSKGLLATRFIKQGTLLLASKAFAITYKSDAVNSQAENVVKTKQVLKRNPQWAKELYSLYAGCDQRDEICSSGTNDFQVENICRLNSFETQHAFDITKSSEDLASGLWILPSFLNHSCVANACRIFYADVMMVYAISDIEQGEEINHSYIDPFTPILKDWPTFNATTLSLSHTFFDAIQIPQQQIKIFEPILTKLRQSYANRNELKTQMYGPLLKLFTAYKEVYQSTKPWLVLELCDYENSIEVKDLVEYIHSIPEHRQGKLVLKWVLTKDWTARAATFVNMCLEKFNQSICAQPYQVLIAFSIGAETDDLQDFQVENYNTKEVLRHNKIENSSAARTRKFVKDRHMGKQRYDIIYTLNRLSV
uniref:SET domain-containing protein n=1 Tax=Ditylenchus dipsaci TaxID=166011 RepID=A0A915E796_9BILA